MSRARDTAGIIQYNKISIDSNNAVGIGSSIPDTKLDVNGGVRVTGIVTASSFEGDGSSLTGIDASSLKDGSNIKAQAFGGGVNITGITTADAFVGFDYLQAPYSSSTVNFSVTVATKTAAHRYNGSGSSNGYVINGTESPFLTLTPGITYRFTLSSGDMTSHPFRFYLEADKTTAYTTNVTSTSTYTEITVTDTTPIVLHYQCSSHALMGNAVQVNSNKIDTPYRIDVVAGGANITGIVTATSFSGTVNSSNLTGALPALDGSALTSLTSSNLSGALPALDGSALTNLNIPATFDWRDGSLF
jgi:hypothetical protein